MRKTYKFGRTVRVATLYGNYLHGRPQPVIALELALAWRPARTLRDSVPVTIERVEPCRMAGRQAYVLVGRDRIGTLIRTPMLFGINAIPTVIAR